jgi:hypothetical protein
MLDVVGNALLLVGSGLRRDAILSRAGVRIEAAVL